MATKVDVCTICNGVGCVACHHSGYIEVSGGVETDDDSDEDEDEDEDK